MALPRSLIGAGLGAAAGGAAGATADSEHRIRSGLLGAAAGGAAGGVAHGVGRAVRLHGLGFSPAGALEAGILSPDTVAKTKKTIEGYAKKGKLDAAQTAAREAHELHGAGNPFHGMGSDSAKARYRKNIASLHPDKPGGNAEAFDKMNQQYKAHQATNPPRALLTKEGAVWYFFFDELFQETV